MFSKLIYNALIILSCFCMLVSCTSRRGEPIHDQEPQPIIDQPTAYEDKILTGFLSSNSRNFEEEAEFFGNYINPVKNLGDVKSAVLVDEIELLANDLKARALRLLATPDPKENMAYDGKIRELLGKVKLALASVSVERQETFNSELAKLFETSKAVVATRSAQPVDFVDSDNILSTFIGKPIDPVEYEALALFLDEAYGPAFGVGGLVAGFSAKFDALKIAVDEINDKKTGNAQQELKDLVTLVNGALHQKITLHAKQKLEKDAGQPVFDGIRNAIVAGLDKVKVAEKSQPKTVADIEKAIKIADETQSVQVSVVGKGVAQQAKDAAGKLYERAAAQALKLAQLEAANAAKSVTEAKAAAAIDVLLAKPKEAEDAAKRAESAAKAIESFKADDTKSAAAKESATKAIEAADRAAQEKAKALAELKINVVITNAIKDSLKPVEKRLSSLKGKLPALGGATEKGPANEVEKQANKLEVAVSEADKLLRKIGDAGVEVAAEFKALQEASEQTVNAKQQAAQTVVSVVALEKSKEFIERAKKADAAINAQLELIKTIVPKETVVGLENCGNTCFMNSIFQSLFHTREINRLLQLPFDKLPFAKGVDKDGSLLKIFQTVFSNYNTTTNSSVSTQPLSEARARFFGQFVKGSQDDAQEFLTAFLDQLGSELNVVEGKLAYYQARDVDEAKFDFKENWKKAGSTGEYSLINHWFGGFYKSVVKKTKGADSQAYDSFSNLTLNFPETDVAEYGLDEMYNNFAKEEDLIDSPGNKSRKMTVNKGPVNLIIHLKRFKQDDYGNRTKIDKKVTYPKDWSLNTELGNVGYELYAIALHSGSLSGGHYVANVKAGAQWYYASDTSTNKISEDQALGIGNNNKSDAYLLFYRRK